MIKCWQMYFGGDSPESLIRQQQQKASNKNTRVSSFISKEMQMNDFCRSPGHSGEGLFPCLLPQHIYAIIFECAKLVRWEYVC